MPDGHVEEYVRENLRRGYTPDSIKEMLRVSGYDPAIVDQIMSGASPSQQSSPSGFQGTNSSGSGLPGSTSNNNTNNTPQGNANISGEFQKMGFIEKAKMIVFNPKGFFDIMPQSGGYGEPFKFAILNIFIAVILSAILATISKGIDNGIVSLIILSIAIFISLIYLTIVLFVVSGINHLFLKLMGAKKNYEATFRVVSYITPFQILSSISSLKIPGIELIGILIALYMLYALVIGYNKVHEITKLRALAAILMPGIILLSIAIIIALIIPQFSAIPLDGRCMDSAIGFPTENTLTPDGNEYAISADGSGGILVKNKMDRAITLQGFAADGAPMNGIGQTINPGAIYPISLVAGTSKGGKLGDCYDIPVTLTYDISNGPADMKSTGHLRGRFGTPITPSSSLAE